MAEPAAVCVTFTSLYGTGKHEPLCSVLRVDDITILLDCGWTDAFDEALVAPLIEYGLPLPPAPTAPCLHGRVYVCISVCVHDPCSIAPTVDVVLLSHADMEHCGAIPYAVSKVSMCVYV